MGIRGELFSTKVSCEGRTYFFNVKQNRMGDVFLSIVESKPTEADSFDRRSIVIFRDDLRGFLKAFQATLGYMEKPGTVSTEMSFEPKDAAPPRPRPGAPSARTGDGSKAGPPKKRRVVVRRKPSATDDDSPK